MSKYDYTPVKYTHNCINNHYSSNNNKKINISFKFKQIIYYNNNSSTTTATMLIEIGITNMENINTSNIDKYK